MDVISEVEQSRGCRRTGYAVITVRLSDELHQAAKAEATILGKSLNQFCAEWIEAGINCEQDMRRDDAREAAK